MKACILLLVLFKGFFVVNELVNIPLKCGDLNCPLSSDREELKKCCLRVKALKPITYRGTQMLLFLRCCSDVHTHESLSSSPQWCDKISQNYSVKHAVVFKRSLIHSLQ